MFYKLLELNKRAPVNGHILTELSEGEINEKCFRLELIKHYFMKLESSSAALRAKADDKSGIRLCRFQHSDHGSVTQR